MRSININKFRDSLKTFVDQSAERHEPIRITRKNGKDFVVMSFEDWESEQETIHVLQDPYLMKQIRAYQANPDAPGYTPTPEEMNEILSVEDE